MKKTFALLFLLGCFGNAQSQTISSDIIQKRWDAFWITVPGATLHEYGVYHFRKKISLNQKPAQFIVHVSGDNRYKLFVNGTLVSLGPARGGIYNWNFETVDIAPFLQQGDNSLAAVVWNFGDERPEAQVSYQTAFILQGDSDKEKIVNTDKSWLCTQDSAYSPLSPLLVYSYYVAGPTEKIDYHHYPSGWMDINYNVASWKPAQQLFNGLPKGIFYWTLGWMLVPRPIPQMEIKEQRLQKIRSSNGIDVGNEFLNGNKKFTVPPNSKISVLIDQEHLTTGYPVFIFSKGNNAKISLSYAEGLYIDEGTTKDWRAQNKKGNRNEIEGKRFVGLTDELISNGNDNQSFTPLWWRTYRYIKLDIETKDESLSADDLYGLYEGYPFKMNAGFESSDAALPKILETGWRTARLDAHETYMDCPYYEQLQYVGDTRIQALVSLYNSGDDRLMRNAIEQIRNSLMAEGITLSRYPTAHPQQIPTFSLLWIGMVYDYWMYRGDKNFINKQLPVARMVLSFFNQFQQNDGSLKNVPYWNFTDWVNDKGWDAGVAPISKDGTSAAMDLQLLMAYQTAALLEKQTGMQSFSDVYTKQAGQLKQSIVANYWSPQQKMFSDTKEKLLYSQHCNSLAILTNLVTGPAATTLAKAMLTDTGISKTTVYFRYYLNRAIVKAGLGNLYLHLLDKWKENLSMGLTTWAEMDDVSASRSDCHAWGSSPNIELYRVVLGIDSDAPGFSKVKIEPHLGTLKNASGFMPHPKGKITVSYKQEVNGKWNCFIDLPLTVSGTFIWNGQKRLLHEGGNSFVL
jgi:hypothetical protein